MLKIRSLYRHCWRVCLFCVPFAADAGRTGALRPVKTGQATPLLLRPLLPRHSCRVGCRPPPVQLCSGLDKRWWRVHLDEKEKYNSTVLRIVGKQQLLTILQHFEMLSLWVTSLTDLESYFSLPLWPPDKRQNIAKLHMDRAEQTLHFCGLFYSKTPVAVNLLLRAVSTPLFHCRFMEQSAYILLFYSVSA